MNPLRIGGVCAPSPLVSVAIPSYNHEEFLAEAIESVLAQTYLNFELIIVDDGSTDGSLRIAEDYAERYPQTIQLFTHPKNLGISATVNQTIVRSKGKYWTGMSSDDVIYPEKLSRQVEFLESNPDVGFVYCPTDLFDANGVFKVFGRNDISTIKYPLDGMIWRCAIWGPAVMVRRKALPVDLYDEDLIYSDWDMWIRIMAHWRVGFIDVPLTGYRAHGHNTSFNYKNGKLTAPPLHAQRVMAVFKSLREKRGELDSRTQALVDLKLASLFFEEGDITNAMRSLVMALATNVSVFTIRNLSEVLFGLGLAVIAPVLRRVTS